MVSESSKSLPTCKTPQRLDTSTLISPSKRCTEVENQLSLYDKGFGRIDTAVYTILQGNYFREVNMMADAEMEVRDTEKDESTQKSDKAAHMRANRHLYEVLPVGLPADKWEPITKEANDLAIGPSCALARIWILDSLRKVGNGAELPVK